MDTSQDDILEEFKRQNLELPVPTSEDHVPDIDTVLPSPQDYIAGVHWLEGFDNNAGREAQHDHTVQAAPPLPHLQVAQSGGYRWPVRAPGSKTRGVRRSASGAWQARIWFSDYNLDGEKRGMLCFVGSFSTEDEAKQAHDKVTIRFDLRVYKKNKPYELNYPQERYAQYIAEHALWSRRDYFWKIRRDSPNFSSGDCRLRGVRLVKKLGKWNGRYSASVSATVEPTKKKEIVVGKFDTEEEAGKAYDLALLFVQGMYSSCITNFRPGLYTQEDVDRMGSMLTWEYPRLQFKKHERVL